MFRINAEPRWGYFTSLQFINSIIPKNFAMMKLIALIIIFSGLSLNTQAQVAVNTDGSTANSSAMFDIKSTDKGILIPRLTTDQRNAITSPANGLLVYDTWTESFWYYNDLHMEWQQVGNASAGAKEINGLTDATYDGSSLYLGFDAGKNDDGSSNSNISIGRETLKANTSGNANVATGYRAMYSNISGANNTSTGTNSLYKNTTGFENVVIGKGTMYSNTTGYSNTAIGVNTMFSNTTAKYNTASGSGAMYSNTTGNNNVADGYQALYSNTTGHSNIAVGAKALKSNTTLSNLIAIGDSALYNNGTGASGNLEAKENVAIGTKAL